jgi:hypothetical protein
MIFVQIKNGLPLKVRYSYPNEFEQLEGGWQSRIDWDSYEKVCGIARYITAMTGVDYVGTDSGGKSSPRFDIIAIPKIGDRVSYAFNGDSYPDGEVTCVSGTRLTVLTSTGNVYRRKKLTGKWFLTGGSPWSLVHGHVEKQNPEF